MRLIVINSSSMGNAYALDSGDEILLLEAGVRMAEVKKAIDFRLKDVVGCVVTHEHGDHFKHASEYAKFGIDIYGHKDIPEKRKQFPYGKFHTLKEGSTKAVGSFRVVPFANHHDVPIFGYIIWHKDMGSLLFSTDSYKISQAVTGINHFLIEANYSDELLKQNVWSGRIDKAQADRIMLSHMSLEYCIKYLRDCQVTALPSPSARGRKKFAGITRTITLCHLSERNSDPELFRRKVAGAFGIPCFIAQRKAIIELNKEVL